MDAERWRALVLADLLGELDEAEHAELVAEIARRGAPGRAEADAIRDAVGSLGLAAAPLRPPPALRDRVLSALPDEEDEPEPPVTPALAAPPAREADPGRSRGRMWIAVAMAATVAAIALGWNTLRLEDELDGARGELQLAQSRAEAADALRDSLATLVQDVSTLLRSEGVALSGTSPEVVARARVFVDVDSGRTLLLVDDLPVLPPDQVYQLWAIRGDVAAGAGVFRLEREGPAWIELAESTELSEADLLAVTVEQAPGAAAPTSTPILAGGT